MSKKERIAIGIVIFIIFLLAVAGFVELSSVEVPAP